MNCDAYEGLGRIARKGERDSFGKHRPIRSIVSIFEDCVLVFRTQRKVTFNFIESARGGYAPAGKRRGGQMNVGDLVQDIHNDKQLSLS